MTTFEPFERDGDKVTLRMDVATWETLLWLLGLAGSKFENDKPAFYHHLAFMNALNVGNPAWAPYVIPKKYRERT